MRSFTARLCCVVLLAAAAIGSAQAQQTPPEDPKIDPDVGALVLFDKRDFVTVEGYQILAGKPFKTEVVRNNVVVGAAWSIGSGGDVAAEVNHPGGECWGADGKRPTTGPLTAPFPDSLKVTPDIRKGDLVQIRNENDLVVGGHRVLDVSITKTSSEGAANFVVEGLIGTGVNRAFLECRIIQPDWVDTFGRRDARALPSEGALTPSDKGGYSYSMDINSAGGFVAIFEFTDPADRELALTGGPRIMAWMDETPDGERLGLTIHEFGEAGGPGMGGCPGSPDQLSAPSGSFAAKKDGATVTFTWNKPEAAADASEVVGYYMAAMEPAAGTPPQGAEVGKRIMNPASGSATVPVDTTKSYEYELRSINKDGAFSKAFVAQRTGTQAPVGGGGTPPPPLAATLNGNVVTFSAPAGTTPPATFGEGGSLELWYTISELEDANPVTIGGDTVALGAIKYEEPFPLDVTKGTRFIHWIVFNKDGLYKTETVKLDVAGAPLIETPPTLLDTVIGQEALTVRWNTSDTNIAKFDVQVFDKASGGAVVGESPPVTGLAKAVREYTVTGLKINIDYWVTVRGVNAAGIPSEFAARKGPVKTTGITDKITISASGRFRAGKEFRADGTASDTTAVIRLCRGSTNAQGQFVCTPIPGAQSIQPVAGIAPASATWSIRMSNNAVPAGVNPLYAMSSKGGKAGPVTLAARRLRRAM